MLKSKVQIVLGIFPSFFRLRICTGISATMSIMLWTWLLRAYLCSVRNCDTVISDQTSRIVVLLGMKMAKASKLSHEKIKVLVLIQ